MQKELLNLNDADRHTHRKWTVAFMAIYGSVFLAFACLVMMHPPITDEVIAKVGGGNVTGSIHVATRQQRGH